MKKFTNSRMLQQLVFHTQQNIKATSTQDLDPLPLAHNDHTSSVPSSLWEVWELSRWLHRPMIGCYTVWGAFLGSVGHRVKIHKITPVTDKERGDLEIKRLRGFT